MTFESDTLIAPAGEVTIELSGEDAVDHDVVIEDLDDLLVVEAEAGRRCSPHST